MATPFPALDGSAPKTQKFSEAPEMGIDPSKRYTATMDTSVGTIVIAQSRPIFTQCFGIPAASNIV